MQRKVEISEKAKVSIRWDVKPIDYTPTAAEEITKLFAKKYVIPESNVKLVPNFIASNGNGTVTLNDCEIKNIQDPVFQQQLFEEFLKMEDINDYDLDALIQIDSRVNSMVDYDSYNNGKRWYLNWIQWDNFLSFGKNNFFDFSKLRGIVQLTGEPANESGKSTFAGDLIHFLLFGKVSLERSRTLDGLFNNYADDETELVVKGCITIENQKYVIERILTRGKRDKNKPNKARSVSNKVNFYRVLENDDLEIIDSENLQEESTTKTSQVIKDAIGSEEDFDMIISANSKDLDALISMKDTERGHMLSKWNGLGVIEKKDEIAKGLWKNEKQGRYCDLYTKTGLEEQNEKSEETIKDYEKQIVTLNDRKTSIDNDLVNYKREKDDYLKSIEKVDEDIAKVDIHTIEAKLEKITEDGKVKNNELASLKTELSSFGEISVDEDDYKRKQKTKEELISEIASLTSNYNSLKDSNSRLEKAEYCPTCGKKFDNVDNSSIIAENTKKMNEIIAKGKKKKEEKASLELEIAAIEADRKKLLEKNRVEIKKSAVEVQVEKLRADYKENRDILKRFNDNKEAIRKNNEINNKISILDTTISQLEIDKSKASNEIANYQSEILLQRQNIDKNNKIIVKIAEEAVNEKNWAHYLKIIGKDGIGKMVLQNSIPIMNAELYRLLNDCADFIVEISMNDKKDIEFNLIRDGIKTKLSAASGLERTLASIALRVVLGKMSNLSRPPFILFDEVLGTVHKENYDKVISLFNKIKSDYSFILHICHLDGLEELHDGGTITVVKKDNISRIKE